ncbi:MAG: hypothetical protein H7Y00_16350, partial [Fimbriimonadaceae bacterium]|nr:hypothetical protein [Chitinophagales bacterium]
MKTKKLIQYSALAAGFLSAGNTADAQVIYTDVDPDTLLTPFYDDQYDIDMNADGIADFRFKLHSFGWTIYEGYDYIAQLEALYDNKIGYIIDTSFIECSSWIHTEKVIPVLEEEDTIDAVTNFAGGNILFASVSNDDFPCYDSGYNFGSWLEKTEKFAAVQLEVDAETYYGWIRLSMNGWYEITLHDFAYESIAGVPIIAGRTSGTIAPATMPANNVVLSDINNFGDGRDLQIAFNKAEDEININAYRIYITPSYATPFTIDTALSLPADRFRETPPTGSDIVFNFDE